MEVVMPFCWLTTTDDLARWEPWGIPSAWRSPTARRPGGSPRRDWRQSSGSSAPGPSCGSPGGGRWDAPPSHPAEPGLGAGVGYPGGLPARRGHVVVGPCCVWRCSAAGRTPARALVVERAGELRKCWLIVVDVGWCWVRWFVPDLCWDCPEPDTISTPVACRAAFADDDHLGAAAGKPLSLACCVCGAGGTGYSRLW